MSSRELLDELLGIVTDSDDDGTEWLVSAEFLPPISALNRAIRQGDWSFEEYREARLVNEIAASRADGRGYTPDFLKSPLEVKQDQEHDDWQVRRHDEVLAQLRGEG